MGVARFLHGEQGPWWLPEEPVGAERLPSSLSASQSLLRDCAVVTPGLLVSSGWGLGQGRGGGEEVGSVPSSCESNLGGLSARRDSQTKWKECGWSEKGTGPVCSRGALGQAEVQIQSPRAAQLPSVSPCAQGQGGGAASCWAGKCPLPEPGLCALLLCQELLLS